MILYPNAKINLGLNITERRPDGYHNLESLFLPVGWRDVLEIVPAKGDRCSLTVYGNTPACAPEDNLVMKAWRALSGSLPHPLPPVDIYLEKIIPEGAGLGGGSADASFMLKGLNEMFALGLNDEKLAAIAATLGADCPFFIYNKPMMATGTGTTLTPVDVKIPPYYIVIIKPDIFISTKEAYAGVHPQAWPVGLERLIAEQRLDEIVNDFEKSVGPAHPEIEEIKRALKTNGACYASMSGSGSAVYGLFEDETSARAASAILTEFGHTFCGRI